MWLAWTASLVYHTTSDGGVYHEDRDRNRSVSEHKELLVCVGAIESVLIYSGRNSDDKFLYSIWWAAVLEINVMDSDGFYFFIRDRSYTPTAKF